MRTFGGVPGSRGNGDEQRRRWILFWAGLVGLFLYLALSTLTGRFQIEWVLAFLTMMGVSLSGVFKS